MHIIESSFYRVVRWVISSASGVVPAGTGAVQGLGRTCTRQETSKIDRIQQYRSVLVRQNPLEKTTLHANKVATSHRCFLTMAMQYTDRTIGDKWNAVQTWLNTVVYRARNGTGAVYSHRVVTRIYIYLKLNFV